LFIGMRARSATSSAIASPLVIGAWEHEVDMTTAKRVLDGEVPVDVTG